MTRKLSCAATSVSLIAIAIIAIHAPRTARAGAGVAAVSASAKGVDAELMSLVVEEAAKDAGWEMAPSRLRGRAIAEAIACVDKDRPLPCLAPMLASHTADRFVFVDVEQSPDDAGVLRLSAIVVLPDSSAPAAAERFCRACKEGALRDATSELVRGVIRDAEVASGRTVLEIAVTPAGAWIYLDGESLPTEARGGKTFARAPTFPGPHVITVEKAEFQSEVRDVRAILGEVTQVSVALRSTKHGAPIDGGVPRSNATWPRTAAWALIGAGAASAIAGATLIALDEDHATGPDVPHSDRYFDSATFGAALLGAGVGVSVAGLVWWWVQPKGRARVSAWPGGASVVWGFGF